MHKAFSNWYLYYVFSLILSKHILLECHTVFSHSCHKSTSGGKLSAMLNLIFKILFFEGDLLYIIPLAELTLTSNLT